MVTSFHYVAWALPWSCSLAAAADDVSLVQAAFNVRAPELPTWLPKDPWLDDLVIDRLEKERSRESSQEEEACGAGGVIVYPPAKLAFLHIPKVASMQFSRLFNHLNGLPGIFCTSEPRRFNLSPADISRENGWTWGLFLRNPLLRFLSAWGNKCGGDRFERAFCWPHGSVTNHSLGTIASVADFHTHVETAWSTYWQKGLPPDNHWRGQLDQCGDTSNYDFVGLLEGDVHGQVRRMLEMVGAPVDSLEEFFPRVGIAGHTTALDPNAYYNNITQRYMVGRMYERDYTLPGLGEPPKKR